MAAAILVDPADRPRPSAGSAGRAARRQAPCGITGVRLLRRAAQFDDVG
ncbi:hypothetical protein [Trebonia kvetii]|nr:hypothetical protein [Trebonia kvetii]